MILGIFTIGFIIGLIAVNIYGVINEGWDFGDILLSLVVASLIWLVMVMIYIGIYEVTEEKIGEKSIDKQNIYSIRDDSSIEGSFSGGIFLVRGSIEEVDYYYYWVKTKDGMHRKKKKADNSYIIEEDIEQPYVETFEPICKSIEGEGECFDIDNKYVFHIPKGSIEYNYNLK